MNLTIRCLLIILVFSSCVQKNRTPAETQGIGAILTKSNSADGQMISWKEHIIDDTFLGGVDLSGSDGLSIGDLDKDGFIDIVSVHESDTEYDGALSGCIRIAFGNSDYQKWESVTLAKGEEAAAAEDVAIEDINGDGFLDIIAACELGHLIYFQNPTKEIRHKEWTRLIPGITQERGSFIRVFTSDFNQDGKVEIVAANKGDQLAEGLKDDLVKITHPVSYFEIKGDPLNDSAWKETVLVEFEIPINAQPVDIDQDGDPDVVAGSRGENRIVIFENTSKDSIGFIAHPIKIKRKSATGFVESKVNGFNMVYFDVNADGRLDIVLFEIKDKRPLGTELVWLEQPTRWTEDWIMHSIGSTAPDRIVGIEKADINSDGLTDVLIGGYSRGARDRDDDLGVNASCGRLAWFENPGSTRKTWKRHDISRRRRGMFDKFISMDLDQDGDVDFLSTRGNSAPYDGVIWLEQIRTPKAVKSFTSTRIEDSKEMALPLE